MSPQELHSSRMLILMVKWDEAAIEFSFSTFLLKVFRVPGNYNQLRGLTHSKTQQATSQFDETIIALSSVTQLFLLLLSVDENKIQLATYTGTGWYC